MKSSISVWWSKPLSQKEPIPRLLLKSSEDGLWWKGRKVTVEGMIGEKKFWPPTRPRKVKKWKSISTSWACFQTTRIKLFTVVLKRFRNGKKKNVNYHTQLKWAGDTPLLTESCSWLAVRRRGKRDNRPYWTGAGVEGLGIPAASEDCKQFEKMISTREWGTREGVMDTEVWSDSPINSLHVDDPIAWSW